MSRILLLTLFLSLVLFTFCQSSKLPDTICIPESLKKLTFALKDTAEIRFSCSASINVEPLLYIINDSLKTTHFEQFILSQNSIESVDVLKYKKSKKLFGKATKYGAIINIKTKHGIKIFSLTDLFEQYHIKTEDRILPICINNYFLKKSNKIVSDNIEIKSITIEEGQYKTFNSNTFIVGKYINISTM